MNNRADPRKMKKVAGSDIPSLNVSQLEEYGGAANFGIGPTFDTFASAQTVPGKLGNLPSI